MDGIVHAPVLLGPVLEHLPAGDGKVVVDGTLGEGGHSEALLERGCRVYGIEQDPAIAATAGARLARFGGRFTLLPGNFSRLRELLAGAGVTAVDGILLDLGISSFHYEKSGRGFSFQRAEPLDMRLSGAGPSAAEIVAGWPEARLADCFYRYGEERQSRRIAAAIVRERAKAPIETAARLAEIVKGAVPGKYRGDRIHPATRVFQALRIEVNGELDALAAVLPQALELLVTGGRLCVISFHSLEDRIVKEFIRDETPHCRCPAEAWRCECGKPGRLAAVTRKPLVADGAEAAANPRSRSAKLRVAERI